LLALGVAGVRRGGWFYGDAVTPGSSAPESYASYDPEEVEQRARVAAVQLLRDSRRYVQRIVHDVAPEATQIVNTLSRDITLPSVTLIDEAGDGDGDEAAPGDPVRTESVTEEEAKGRAGGDDDADGRKPDDDTGTSEAAVTFYVPVLRWRKGYLIDGVATQYGGGGAASIADSSLARSITWQGLCAQTRALYETEAPEGLPDALRALWHTIAHDQPVELTPEERHAANAALRFLRVMRAGG
jgi:hypothetical protein